MELGKLEVFKMLEYKELAFNDIWQDKPIQNFKYSALGISLDGVCSPTSKTLRTFSSLPLMYIELETAATQLMS